MKRVTSLILLFMALLWAGSTWGATVQIGTGTTTNTNLPIVSCYGYTYSQQIYLGSEISTAGGANGPITKVRFFYSSGGTTYANWSNWTVYIGTTAKTAFASTTDWEPLANLTQVFSGTIPTPVAGTWLELTLSTPFNYTGGNLIVAVDENSSGYSCSAAWRSFVATGSALRGIYYRNDNTNPSPAAPPTAYATTSTIAQIQFEMQSNLPNMSATPGTLAFSYTASGSYSVEKTYVLSGGNLTSSPIAITAPAGFEVSLTSGAGFALSLNLAFTPPTLANTTIFVRFAPTSPSLTYSGNITNTGGGGSATVAVTGTSDYYSQYCASAATSSGDEDITLVQFGSSLNNATACASLVGTQGTATGTANLYSNFTAAVPPTNVQRTVGQPISVQITECGGTAYSHDVRVYIDFNKNLSLADAGEEFIIWPYASSNTHTINASILIPANAALGNTLMRIVCKETSTTGPCVVSSYGETEDYVININEAPPCVPPSGLAADNITTTSARLSWVENGTSSQWKIEYGALGFTQGSGTIISVSDNPHTINGLSPASKYSFYVQADCGSGMLSTWAGPSSFLTECEPSILPFTEGFESADFPPICWENTGWVSSLYGGAHTGTKWAYSNLAGSKLLSPEIVIPASGGYQLSFWYRVESASYPQDFNVLISTDGVNFDPVMNIVGAVNATYVEAVLKLLDYSGQHIWVRFDGLTGTGGYAYGVCVDDVTVDLIPPPGFLSGIVTDAVTGNPLNGALITTNPGGKTATSNGLGWYTIQLEKGTYSATYEKNDFYGETVTGIVINSSATTIVNVSLGPIPPPFCATLVGPTDGETSVLPNANLTWTAGAGSPLVLGYRIQLFNLTTGVWLEGDDFTGTDLGNVTSYTPAEPFDWGTDYVWLITPYNNAGSAEGCSPWYFSTSSGGNLHGIVKDASNNQPIGGANVLIEQTYPAIHAGATFNLTSAADGTWNFAWESGIYKITYSKFTYVSKTVTNIAIYANQVTNQSVLLTPVTPYQIPFVEKWNTGTTFTTQQWSIVPATSNWSIYTSIGNPAPTARFYFSPEIFNYERTLQSYYINGIGKPKIYAQFDLSLDNYSNETLETMTFGLFDGTQWHNIAMFDNQTDLDIPWTTFTYDISALASGKLFLIGFKAAGEDSYNIDNWYIDNIGVFTDMMAVSPASLSQSLGKTQTASQNIVITNPGPNTLAWNATFDAPTLWATMPMSGTVPAGSSVSVPVTFDANPVPAGVYNATVTIHGPSGLVQSPVSLHLNIFELQVNPLTVFDEINTTEVVTWNITLTNPGTLPFAWNATFTAQPWFSLSESSGTLPGGGTKVLTLTLDGTTVAPDAYNAQILFSGAGGLTTKTVNIGLNVYDFILDPEAVYDALYVGGTVTNQVDIHNPYTAPIAWSANVPSLSWLSMTPVSGTIPAGGTVTLDVTFSASGLLSGEYSSQITINAAGGNVVKDLPVGLNVYDTPYQKVMIPEAKAWGYISSYINLNSKMTLEEAMQNILDEMVLMIGENGIFWPSQNINTIGNWNPNSGYKLKMEKEGLLVYVGNEVTVKIINFTKGVHIIPVLSDQPVSVEDLFAGKPVEFAFGMDGSIYWPAGNIYTLNTLYPGYGYMVKFTSATSLNFTGLKGGVKPNSPPIYTNKTAWNNVSKTGDAHFISISNEACSELLPGDVIGVFNLEGLCTGMAEYRLSDKSFALTVYADDETTQPIDGMIENQPLQYKVYRNGVALDIEPVYNTNMPNYDGLFAINGLSQIKSFKVGSIGIGENEKNSISIYPNPSSGIFNVDVNGFDAQLRFVVINSQGQEIFSSTMNSSAQIDLTSQPRGVYFVKIIGNDVLRTEKLIVK